MSQLPLYTLYQQLWESAFTAFQTHQFTTDPYLPNKHPDTRRGLSLICRPSEPVRERIAAFLQQAQAIAPAQYYYQEPEFHTTVLTLISCDPDFRISELPLSAYLQVLQEGLEGQMRGAISYQGITASSSAIMVQGFPLDGQLELIRNRVRGGFKDSGLYHTIDKRYKLTTAHSTVIRFVEVPQDPTPFLDLLQAFRSFEFGESPLTEIELVHTDWYMSREKAEVLYRFPLDSL